MEPRGVKIIFLLPVGRTKKLKPINKVGEGNGNPLQYSCLGNPMDKGAWWAVVLGVEKEMDTTERTKPTSTTRQGTYSITHMYIL